ncbi:MAG TPA: 50S ribosomal protein L3 [Mycoplasmatales bacterium]|jgi:large subunit ribosomal protein L3|nr:50S ribosomal protein L3 [Mycoplasmatales bacterium]
MNLALIGRKVGSTIDFHENGRKIIELTVISISPNIISQIKRKEREGYNSLQLASEDCKELSLNKSQILHLKKNGISPKKIIREVKISSDVINNYSIGDILDLMTIFSENDKVKVTGKSKGKGFSGVIKRHHHSRGPMAHGSGYHRGVGSMGSINSNKVPKGKKLPGRMGCARSTVRNITIHKIDKNLITVRGSIPGPVNGIVLINKEI